MRSNSIRFAIALAGAGTAVVAMAQSAQSPGADQLGGNSTAGTASKHNWVAPGTPGSPINGEIFHAQLLLSQAGFSPGPIDGKKGQSLGQAVRGFQTSRGIDVTGVLDAETRRALAQGARPSTVMVRLGPDDVRSQYVYPFPKKPEAQAKLPFLGYRNMLEKVAERYHTTPDTIVALNGPEKLIGPGQTLRLPNVVPGSRDYAGLAGKGGSLLNLLNVDASQPQGDYIVVDKSEAVLKVYRGPAPADADDTETAKTEDASATPGQLVAQFPVTLGSKQYPLPIGRWKVTTYAFLPPFHYQPALLKGADKSGKDLQLPAGPNGPVGVAWLDLTKEHYGIHGTPEPQLIGRAESSGCIRLTNWDVARLARIMKPGFTAIFQA